MTEDAQPTAPADLVAELWYEEAPDLADEELGASLRRTWPEVELQGGSITVPHGDGDGERSGVRLTTAVIPGSPLGHHGKTRPDASQTWDWAEAETVVDRGRQSIVVTELGATGLSPQTRVSALAEVVAELIRSTGPLAISWGHSQRVSDPATWVAGDLDGVINVRMFSVGSGDLLMDTLGLHVFDLPDLQCHFRGRTPGEIATLLFLTAVYVFDAGDVIGDGETIAGPDGSGPYVCRHEPALLEPRRTVLDIDLGDPYAAGDRVRPSV